jgi:hypothetical protein
MPWYYYVAHFFAGVFLANGVPHFVQGVSGNAFQTPFAAPPGVGESSAAVNVVWGWVNFVIAGVLVMATFPPLPPPAGGCIAFALGALAIGLFLAMHFGKVRRGPPTP